MFRRNRLLNLLQTREAAFYLLVFAVFLIFHIIVFRGILAQVPEVFRGDAVVVREELVPFFSFSEQFSPSDTSALTGSDEVRVAYSFWTSWVRQAKILPFALVLLNTISAVILFHSFYIIGSYFTKRARSLAIISAALLAAFFIHFILLYAKVTHFYTLVFGFSLFAWSLALVLEQLFFLEDIEWRNIVAVSLLVLLNPAIHYHIIFYLALVIFVALKIIVTYIHDRKGLWSVLKHNAVYLTVITLLSLVPYIFYISWSTGVSTTSVSTQIPVNFLMIYYTSIPLEFLFSFNTASQIDFLHYGAYLVPSPRIAGIVVMAAIVSLILMPQWKGAEWAKKSFILSAFVALLISMWMSLGYAQNSQFSFHFLLRDITLLLSQIDNAITGIMQKLIGVFINILRFPHRFQFIYFYLAGVLLTIALAWLYENVQDRFSRPAISTLVVVLVIVAPILSNGNYRNSIISGNFDGFLRPYKVPSDLNQIKNKLAVSRDNRLFILPTLESGRQIESNGHRYGFIDKFFIFYLNQPTVYYGTGASPDNKIIASMIYQSLNKGDSTWESLAINNLGVNTIVHPKTTSRERGYMYYPDIDSKIRSLLDKSTKFKRTVDGKEYALYQLIDRPGSGKHTLLDTRRDGLFAYLQTGVKSSDTLYFPIQIQNFLSQRQSSYIYTDKPERSFYNLYKAVTKGSNFLPNQELVAFNGDLVSSSTYTSNAMSIGTLSNPRDEYNYLKEDIPNLANLQSQQFIGLAPGKGQIMFNFKAANTERHRVLLHASTRLDELEVEINNRKITFSKLKDSHAHRAKNAEFAYFYADINLAKGNQKLKIKNDNKPAVAAESLTIIPYDSLPKDFKSYKIGNLKVSPTQETQVLRIEN